MPNIQKPFEYINIIKGGNEIEDMQNLYARGCGGTVLGGMFTCIQKPGIGRDVTRRYKYVRKYIQCLRMEVIQKQWVISSN